MAFVWTPNPEPQSPVEGLDQQFETQQDAEAWLSAVYEDLMDAGVESVTLNNDGQPAYQMSLAEN